MQYLEFIEYLSSFSETEFAEFQRQLIPTKYQIMGVRTPKLREIAKQYAKDLETVFSFPNEYYEVVFIKLTIVSALPYERFLAYLDECVALMDNWALCDTFKARCLKQRKTEFLPVLKRIFERGGEYEERYPLVTLLSFYAEKKYLPEIERYIKKANTQRYYVHMAVAWLMAEILIKEYELGVALLCKRLTDVKTHNKAIQKAIESYRLNDAQKEFLRSLKIKTNNKIR